MFMMESCRTHTSCQPPRTRCATSCVRSDHDHHGLFSTSLQVSVVTRWHIGEVTEVWSRAENFKHLSCTLSWRAALISVALFGILMNGSVSMESWVSGVKRTWSVTVGADAALTILLFALIVMLRVSSCCACLADTFSSLTSMSLSRTAVTLVVQRCVSGLGGISVSCQSSQRSARCRYR